MSKKLVLLATLMVAFSGGQMVLRKALFPGNIWPRYVYNDVGTQVQSPIECAAFCKNRVQSCNAIFYNSLARFCGLANLNGNYWFMISQVYQESYGFIDQGK